MNENILFIFFYDPVGSEYSVYSESLHPDDHNEMKFLNIPMENDVCPKFCIENKFLMMKYHQKNKNYVSHF